VHAIQQGNKQKGVMTMEDEERLTEGLCECSCV